ncbi:amino acid ABC transporter permease [Halotalea alkalilenta]|uniref:amino acid ABC transporter permease n=1 Tax=Halotalea alkalilenta TaxID=376489 RepID=UPI000AAAF272|nr:amino acid ABC transporter permease [Halotalea alkalilenta]
MIDFTLWDILGHLLRALRWTLALSIIAFVGGGLVGALLTWWRTSQIKALQLLVRGYVELFQGTPLLMQLFLIFFGLSALGINLSAWTAATIALTLFTSAFVCDIWRGSIEAIPAGQWQAARVLGMSRLQTLRHVVLGQAVRIAIAPTVGFSVQVIKGTALASVIGFTELTRTATMLNNAAFMPFTIFGLLALCYFCLCYPLSRYARYLEKRLDVHGSR